MYVSVNHLEDLLKGRLLASTPKVYQSLVLGVWLENLNVQQCLGQTDPASLRLLFENCWFMSSVSPQFPVFFPSMESGEGKNSEEGGRKEKESKSLKLTRNPG